MGGPAEGDPGAWKETVQRPPRLFALHKPRTPPDQSPSPPGCRALHPSKRQHPPRPSPQVQVLPLRGGGGAETQKEQDTAEWHGGPLRAGVG